MSGVLAAGWACKNAVDYRTSRALEGILQSELDQASWNYGLRD